jgi:hypothetical protein
MCKYSPEHKQYLIDSIAEMQLFVDKVINKIYDQPCISESKLATYHRIIDNKIANIQQFKEMLASKYNHIIQ